MSLRRSTIANLQSTVARSIISFAAQPVLIRFLGLERYGAWTVMMSLVTLAYAAELGLISSLTVFASESRSVSDTSRERGVVTFTFATVTAIGVGLTIAWLVSREWLVRTVFPVFAADSDMRLAMIVLGVAVLPRLWQNWLVGWEAGLGRYDVIARGETMNLALLYGSLSVFSFTSGAFLPLAICYLAVTLITCADHVTLMRRAGEKLQFGPVPPGQVRSILRFSFLAWITNIAAVLFTRADRLVANAALGLRGVALYSAAASIAGKVNELSGTVVQPFLPRMSAANARGEKQELQWLFQRAFRLNALVVFLLAAAVIWASPWLSRVMSPVEHESLTLAIVILGAIYSLYTLAQSGYFVVLALKRPDVSAVSATVGAVLALALIWVLGKEYGLIGAGIGNAGYLSIWAMNFIAARLIGLRWRAVWASSIRMILALGATLVLHFANPWPTNPVAIGMGMTLSLLFAYFINQEDFVNGLRILQQFASRVGMVTRRDRS